MLINLERAAIAAEQENFSLLNYHLRQLIEANGQKSPPLTEAQYQQILTLALTVLRVGDFQQQWEVAKLLPQLGQRVMVPLIAIVEDETADLEARWFAGRILGGFDTPEAVIALVKLLESSEDEDLSEMAAQALATIGTSAIAALSESLVKPESRALAVQALARIRRPEVIEPLLEVVDDAVVEIRATAIEALSSFNDPRIPPVLIAALHDPATAVRKEAVIGLGLRARYLPQLDLVNELKPLLYDLNLDICQQAAIALGRIGTDEATEGLFTVLKSPLTPDELNAELVRVLGWNPTLKSLDYLEQGLQGTSDVICREIVRVLGAVESPQLKPKATQILLKFLHSNYGTAQQPSIKQMLALSLGQLGIPDALEPLYGLVNDGDCSVRLHAIAALKKIPEAKQYS